MVTYFDGAIKANLNNLPEEAWTVISGHQAESGNAIELYKAVPFLYRCVDIRAQALSRLPRDIMRGDEPVEEKDEPLVKGFNRLLYQIETAITLYGYAYLFRERNRVRSLGLRWLAPHSVKPRYDIETGLSGFDRGIQGKQQKLEVEDVLYFWQPPIDTEIGPGPAPVLSALFAAGVLESTTKFSKQFFDRGAVFPMLLTVEGNPIKEEMEKLETWWKRLLRGAQSAWETVAVRSTVKPQILSSPIGEMAMTDLTAIQRENIATALGVPHSMVLSNAANFAVSQQDYFNFYDQTIVPEADRIAEVFNEQLFEPAGLRLVFQPKRLEIYQQANLQSADTVTTLVAAKILSKNEGREIVGYEPLEEDEAEPEPQMAPVMMPTADDNEADPADDGPPDARAVDLGKWERKAIKSLRRGAGAAVTFDSLALADYPHLPAVLGLCRSEAEVKAVFAQIDDYKQHLLGHTGDEIDPARLSIEVDFAEIINQFLTQQAGRVAAEAAAGQPPSTDFWQAETAALTALLTPHLANWAEVAIGEAAGALGSVGLGLDADVNARAAEWAGRYAADLAKGLNETSRALVKAKIRNWTTSGQTFEELIDTLEKGIAPRWRAELIASTEVTRAYAEATREVAAEVEVVRGLVWMTARDERVCPICGPLHGRLIRKGASFPGGYGQPPAHPRCRCWLVMDV